MKQRKNRKRRVSTEKAREIQLVKNRNMTIESIGNGDVEKDGSYEIKQNNKLRDGEINWRERERQTDKQTDTDR